MKRINYFVFCLIFSSCFSQEEKIYELWTTFQLEWKINEQWKLNIRNQERFYFDSNIFDIANIQGQLNRKINKKHELLVLYRYTTETLEEHDINRYSLAYEFDQKLIKRFKLCNRIMYQYEQRVYTREPSSTFRNKANLKYSISKKNELSFEYEIFLDYENPWEFEFDKHRYTLEYSRNLKGDFEFNTFYRIDYSLDRKLNKMTHILGFGLNYKI